MVSKPQKQQRDGNHILNQTLNESDILNYFSKGSGSFSMGEKDRDHHMTLHYICTQGSTGVTYYCKKKNAIGTLHISQNWHCRSGRTDPTLLSWRQNLFFSIFFWQCDNRSIDGQKTGLTKDENGSEVQRCTNANRYVNRCVLHKANW